MRVLDQDKVLQASRLLDVESEALILTMSTSRFLILHRDTGSPVVPDCKVVGLMVPPQSSGPGRSNLLQKTIMLDAQNVSKLRYLACNNLSQILIFQGTALSRDSPKSLVWSPTCRTP